MKNRPSSRNDFFKKVVPGEKNYDRMGVARLGKGRDGRGVLPNRNQNLIGAKVEGLKNNDVSCTKNIILPVLLVVSSFQRVHGEYWPSDWMPTLKATET